MVTSKIGHLENGTFGAREEAVGMLDFRKQPSFQGRFPALSRVNQQREQRATTTPGSRRGTERPFGGASRYSPASQGRPSDRQISKSSREHYSTTHAVEQRESIGAVLRLVKGAAVSE
jgi:hypothetical protein